MPLTGNISENSDKTKNVSIGAIKEFDSGHSVSAGAFIAGHRDVVDPMKLNAPSYSVVGGSLGVENPAGSSLGLQAQHISKYGNQMTASSNLNLVRNNDHRLDTNAFVTQTLPNSGPNFTTHGVGVDYKFQERFGANASVSKTPMFNQTNYSAGGNLNLHKTPTTSLDFRAGVNRTDNAFGRGNWEKRGAFEFTKRF